MELNWNLIVLWYLFCGLLVLGFKAFYNLVNKKTFRGGRSDHTTEVGYECKRTGSKRKKTFINRARPVTKRGAGMGLKLK